MTLNCNPKVTRIPALTCTICGGTHVMMTENGPECDDCDIDLDTYVELCRDIEFQIYEQIKGAK